MYLLKNTEDMTFVYSTTRRSTGPSSEWIIMILETFLFQNTNRFCSTSMVAWRSTTTQLRLSESFTPSVWRNTGNVRNLWWVCSKLKPTVWKTKLVSSWRKLKGKSLSVIYIFFLLFNIRKNKNWYHISDYFLIFRMSYETFPLVEIKKNEINNKIVSVWQEKITSSFSHFPLIL